MTDKNFICLPIESGGRSTLMFCSQNSWLAEFGGSTFLFAYAADWEIGVENGSLGVMIQLQDLRTPELFYYLLSFHS